MLNAHLCSSRSQLKLLTEEGNELPERPFRYEIESITHAWFCRSMLGTAMLYKPE